MGEDGRRHDVDVFVEHVMAGQRRPARRFFLAGADVSLHSLRNDLAKVLSIGGDRCDVTGIEWVVAEGSKPVPLASDKWVQRAVRENDRLHLIVTSMPAVSRRVMPLITSAIAVADFITDLMFFLYIRGEDWSMETRVDLRLMAILSLTFLAVPFLVNLVTSITIVLKTSREDERFAAYWRRNFERSGLLVMLLSAMNMDSLNHGSCTAGVSRSRNTPATAMANPLNRPNNTPSERSVPAIPTIDRSLVSSIANSERQNKKRMKIPARATTY